MNFETKKDLRGQIDAVDDQIIKLLLKRIDLSNSIIKSKAHGQIVDGEREKEIFRRFSEGLGSLSTPSRVEGLVRGLLSVSKFYPTSD